MSLYCLGNEPGGALYPLTGAEGWRWNVTVTTVASVVCEKPGYINQYSHTCKDRNKTKKREPK